MPLGLGPVELVLLALCFLLLTGGRTLPELGARLGRKLGLFRASLTEPRYGNVVRTLARARTEAVRLRHRRVGPEHLLMALTAEPDRATEQVLRSLGVSIPQLRGQLDESLVRGADAVDADVPYGRAARSTVELAMTEAAHLGHDRAGPVHVLLALLRRHDGPTGALRSSGVSLERARDEARRALGG